MKKLLFKGKHLLFLYFLATYGGMEKSYSELWRYVPIEGAPPVFQSDLVEVDPQAKIVNPFHYVRQDNSFIVLSETTPSSRTVWMQVFHDWVKPLTPQEAPPSEVQPPPLFLAEMEGEVSFRLPGKIKSQRAEEAMTLPHSVSLQTKEKAYASLWIGDLISLRLGPQTSLSIERKESALGKRNAFSSHYEIQLHLKQGLLFCQKDQARQANPKLRVLTPFGHVITLGADFMVLIGEDGMEVGVIQGKVELQETTGRIFGFAESKKASSLSLVRLPEIVNDKTRLNANSILLRHLVPLINHINAKSSQLYHKSSLSLQEETYLSPILQFSYLLQAKLIEKYKE